MIENIPRWSTDYEFEDGALRDDGGLLIKVVVCERQYWEDVASHVNGEIQLCIIK